MFVVSTFYYDYQLVSVDDKNEKIKESFLNDSGLNSNTKLFNGIAVGKLFIDKIDLEKIIIKSSVDNLQKNIDLNNMVTITNLSNSNLVLFGHYTQTRNLMLNRVYDLEIGDIVKVDNNKEIFRYKLFEMNEINKSELNLLNDTRVKTIMIVTCTKKFNINKYYYLKGQLIR